MDEYISREAVLKAFRITAKNSNKDYQRGLQDAIDCLVPEVIADIPAADVQPIKTSKWCPPLMGQGKCDTYCERCHGKIMRNSTGIFEETPYCPHCGADMRGEQNESKL